MKMLQRSATVALTCRSSNAVASTSAHKLPTLVTAAVTSTLPPTANATTTGYQPYRRWLTTTLPRPHTTSFSSSVPIDKYKHFDAKPALDASGCIPVLPYDLSPLACSAPIYPKGHLIVHPYTQARPESTWPSSVESVCPLLVELNQRKAGELNGWGVSFSEGDPQATRSKPLRFPAWDPSMPKVVRPNKGDETEVEEFLIYAYEGNGKYAVLGPYSLSSLPPTSSEKFLENITSALASAPSPSARYPKKEEESHIYVCSHGSRDCRCGVVGGELKDSLGREARTQELRSIGAGGGGSSSAGWSKKIKVFAVSHIGGHKFAANALVYPHGDWYGNLRLSDTPLLLRSALAPSTSRHDLKDQRERSVHWPRWRGRLGTEEDRMRKVWEEWGGGIVQTAVIAPLRRRATPAPTPTDTDAAAAARALPSEVSKPQQLSPSSSQPPVQAPIAVPFRKHDGNVIVAEARIGENLKDVAKRAGIEEIEATCQGKCECATCHAYLAPAKSETTAGGVESHVGPSELGTPPSDDVTPPASDEEHDMLDYAISRKATSRLTCQVVITSELAAWFHGPEKGRVQLMRY